MMLDRLRYEIRLLGKAVLLTPVLVVIGFALLLAIVNRDATIVARSMSGSLEVLLPVAAGAIVATIVTYDRAIEVQLTMPRRYHRTASLRFLLVLLWSAIVSLLTSLLLYLFNYRRLPVQIVHWSQPWQFLAWQLTWVSSTLWLVAFGLVLSLLIRSRSASGALLCVFAVAELLFHSTMDQEVIYHPIYLFPLTFSPDASYWLLNRFELLGAAAVLFVLAWGLLHIPERLLSHAQGEE
jgi:hypothetical protein